MDIALKVVAGAAPDASILVPDNAAGLLGSEDENLLCGVCSAILVRGVSRATIRARFAVPSRLLIQCPHCSALNVLPAKFGHPSELHGWWHARARSAAWRTHRVPAHWLSIIDQDLTPTEGTVAKTADETAPMAKAPAKKPARKKTAKKRGPGKRYTKSEKAKILAAAAKGNMTGQQAAKKFGISTLTFYRWRGPVRKDAVARRGKRGPGRPKGSGRVKVDQMVVRREVQAQIRKMLPRIIREEVAAALRGKSGAAQ